MKLYKLEAIRGLAAFYVVLHHTISEKSVNTISEGLIGLRLGFLFRFGQEAVILFFILSGFVIHYSFTKSRDKSFKTYFFKRALRIYVPLVMVFFVSYLLATYHAGEFINPDFTTLSLNLLMLQDWEAVKPNVIASAYMGNTPLWSLSYEWWFYMLYVPIVTYLAGPSRHWCVYTAVVTGAVIYTYYPTFPFRILAYFGIWWTGVYLSELYISDKSTKIRHYSLPLCVLILVTTILLIPVLKQHARGEQLLLGLHPLLEVRHFAFSIIAVSSALLWKRLNWIGFDSLVKPFALIAPISYTIYICHVPLMANATYLSFIHQPILQWAGYLICVLLFSYTVEITLYQALRRKTDI